jgi:hypothetical protein
MTSPERLHAALQGAGIPEGFSVVPAPQFVPRSIVRALDELIDVFERVTTRPSWQRAAAAEAPTWARGPRGEVCFFSAWDFHVPADDPEHWQLIEFNDNGSGFVFASRINRAYYEVAGLAADPAIAVPEDRAAFDDRIAAMVEHEARAFFGDGTRARLLILDDADSLARGHFRVEHELLASVLEARGWQTAIGAPEELSLRDHVLQHRGRDVSFVVNRSTDFVWRGDAFAPLRDAFAAKTVYAAPNPFTYLTRSDKRLFELLSSSGRDAELGIEPAERAVLAARVPETHLLREGNVDELAARKHELFFKPAHGYASHGTIAGTDVGRSRLRRLLRDSELYVAQRFVPKGQLRISAGAEPLRTDLRVWAYRGARYLISGRATQSETRRDPRAGGWVPTFVREGQ